MDDLSSDTGTSDTRPSLTLTAAPVEIEKAPEAAPQPDRYPILALIERLERVENENKELKAGLAEILGYVKSNSSFLDHAHAFLSKWGFTKPPADSAG